MLPQTSTALFNTTPWINPTGTYTHGRDSLVRDIPLLFDSIFTSSSLDDLFLLSRIIHPFKPIPFTPVWPTFVIAFVSSFDPASHSPLAPRLYSNVFFLSILSKCYELSSLKIWIQRKWVFFSRLSHVFEVEDWIIEDFSNAIPWCTKCRLFSMSMLLNLTAVAIKRQFNRLISLNLDATQMEKLINF